MWLHLLQGHISPGWPKNKSVAELQSHLLPFKISCSSKIWCVSISVAVLWESKSCAKTLSVMLLDCVKQSGAVLGIEEIPILQLFYMGSWTYLFPRKNISFLNLLWMDCTQTQKGKHTEAQVSFQMKPGRRSCYILNTTKPLLQMLLDITSGSMNGIHNVGCAVQCWKHLQEKNMNRVTGRWVDVIL